MLRLCVFLLEPWLWRKCEGRLRVGNMVDPKYTLGASMQKAYLKS